METRTAQERTMLNELRGFPPIMRDKILRLIRIVREEFVAVTVPPNRTEALLALCGCWRDDRNADEQIAAITGTRKSRSRKMAALK